MKGCGTAGDRCTAILLAAGKGLRIGGAVSKQYREVGGAPLLIHSVRVMTEDPILTDLVVMCPPGDEAQVRRMIAAHGLTGKLRAVVSGGEERYTSVHLGLEAVDWPCEYVFIHDCARPFIDHDTIRRLYEAVCKCGACVAGMPSKDTVKIADADGFVASTPNRPDVWVIQTPQVFSFELIRDAYRQLMEQLEVLRAQGISVTDDAMVAEQMAGCRVKLVEASYRNIKVTTPEDLLIADTFFAEQESSGGAG